MDGEVGRVVLLNNEGKERESLAGLLLLTVTTALHPLLQHA